MTQALAVTHLSSLDAFTFERGARSGRALGRRIADAIEKHRGLVYVIDQGWPLQGKESQPRQEVLARISLRDSINWVKFDEDEEDWDDFLPAFLEKLTTDRASSVKVGGLWFNPNLKSGCATALYVFLRDNFPGPVSLDRKILGDE
jgi:hypothetical protein